MLVDTSSSFLSFSCIKAVHILFYELLQVFGVLHWHISTLIYRYLCNTRALLLSYSFVNNRVDKFPLLYILVHCYVILPLPHIYLVSNTATTVYVYRYILPLAYAYFKILLLSHMLSNIATLAYRYHQMLPLSHMCIKILPLPHIYLLSNTATTVYVHRYILPLTYAYCKYCHSCIC